MRNLAVGLVAALLANSALAQPPTQAPKPPLDTWVFIRFPDGALAWNLNAGRWFENNDRVEGQRLVHYATPVDVDGQKIVWAQEFWTIRCSANTYQIKSGEELTAGLGTAFTLRASDPMPIRDNSTESILKRVYCDNIEFSDVTHVEGLLEVMEAMKTR